jgi:hypothetical protein
VASSPVERAAKSPGDGGGASGSRKPSVAKSGVRGAAMGKGRTPDDGRDELYVPESR